MFVFIITKPRFQPSVLHPLIVTNNYTLNENILKTQIKVTELKNSNL